jgi:hypothetical protein
MAISLTFKFFVRDFGGTSFEYVFDSCFHPFLGGKVVELILCGDESCVFRGIALEGKHLIPVAKGIGDSFNTQTLCALRV